MRSSVAGGLRLGLLLISVVADAGGQQPFRSRCGAGVQAADRNGVMPMLQGALFCPFIADPKSEHSSVSYLPGDFATIAEVPESDTNIGAIGLGDSYGLFRIA